MAKCHRNNVGSLLLHHRHHPTRSRTTNVAGHSRLWTAFSSPSFRRKIFDAVSCGGSSRYHNHDPDDFDSTATCTSTSTRSGSKPQELKQGTLKSQLKERETETEAENAKSEKLSDFLNLADTEIDAQTKKKVESLEELKRAVVELQVEDLGKRQMAATNVRLLAKEDSEARGTLAMLGAIPPLVGMLDLDDPNSQIASLYALLNLAIANDASVSLYTEYFHSFCCTIKMNILPFPSL